MKTFSQYIAESADYHKKLIAAGYDHIGGEDSTTSYWHPTTKHKIHVTTRSTGTTFKTDLRGKHPSVEDAIAAGKKK